MYSLMKEGIGGFSVRAENSADDARLDRAARAIRVGQYPAPTDQRSVFDLVLRRDGVDVFAFTWRDYRGGALAEKTDSPQTRQLHEDLRQADGIVIFCDSVKLLTDPRARRDVRTLVSHVQRTLGERGERLTPLVLALTKADLVDLDDEKVPQRLRAPFLPLIEAVANSRHVAGTQVLVTCGPHPQHVYVPVLWTLGIGIVGRAFELKSSIEDKTGQADHYQRYDTIGDRIFSWLTRQPSARQWSASLREQAQAEYWKYAPLVDPAIQLIDIMRDWPSFGLNIASLQASV
jgi:hypothetical protein